MRYLKSQKACASQTGVNLSTSLSVAEEKPELWIYTVVVIIQIKYSETIKVKGVKLFP
jgi:hypothetical protein